MKGATSLGAKLTLVCIICLSAVAAVAAAFNTVQVNMLKEQMLMGSERLAKEKARLLAQDLEKLEHQGASQPANEEARRRALLERIQLFIKRNDEVVLAGVIEVDNRGIKDVLVSDFHDPKTKREVLGKGGSFQAEMQEGENAALKVVLQRQDTQMPVYMAPLEGSKEGAGLELALAVRDSQTFRQIEAAGALITRRVAEMAGLLSGALILAFIAVWILVNSQARLIQENEQLNRMAYVGTLASGLAHEIRNPLNAMSVNLGVVQEDLEDPRADSEPRVRQIVGRLLHEVEELNQTVVDFMAYAIPRQSHRQRIIPAQIVRGVLDDLEDQIRTRNVDVETQLDEKAEIDGDATGLRQVFYNLALNALEAMQGPGNKLTICSLQANGQLRLDFSDTGEGIDPVDQMKIFEPFHTAKARGSGFGLPIAQRIVRDHGGRIWVDSAPGQGATFHLEFPLPSARVKN